MKVKVFRVRLVDGYQAQDEAVLNQFLDGLAVTQVFASMVQDAWSVLVAYEPGEAESEVFVEDAEVEVGEPDLPLSREEEAAYERLKHWRAERAAQERVPAYFIAHNRWLKALVRLPVRTVDDLLHVKGFGEKRVRRYGDDILRILNGEADTGNSKPPLYLDF
jgi:superfamily II DNA helicase RecQ